MQRFSIYKDYLIATSVLAPAGRPCEASFVINERIGDADPAIIHTGRLDRTFAWGTDARAAATQAAQAYIDGLGGVRP